MPPYMKRLDRNPCATPACPIRATHAVYNTYNAHMGDYCEKHAASKVAEMNLETAVKEFRDAAAK
jgi:hypothetical protein